MKNKTNMKKIKAAAAISAVVLAAFIVVSGPALIADTAPPAPPGNDIYMSDVAVKLTSSDDISGVNYINYTVYHEGLGIENRQIFNDTVTFVCSLPGNYTISYYAVDFAGNVEVEQSKSFTIIPFDTTPPGTEIELEGIKI